MLEEKAVDILNQFEALAKQFAPDVIDAAIGVAQMKGMAGVVNGFVLLLLAVVAGKLSLAAFRFCKKKEEGRGGYSEWVHGLVASATIGGFAVSVLLLFGLGHLLDFWNWVAIFNPKLALAKSILGM